MIKNPYIRLMRFDKPIGMLLLWWPTAWALWLANKSTPTWSILLIFFFGTVIMRTAGCVINDIADRNFDGHVSRTKHRPLVNREVKLKHAVYLLMGLLGLALILLLQLPVKCIYYAVFALFLVFIYPFCKRFFPAPQVFLGLAFSMGIPMAYVAEYRNFDATMVLLLVINFLWTVAYDTEYAMVDKADDVKIGIRSTAILFGEWDRAIIYFLLFCVHFGWLILGYETHLKIGFYGFWALGFVLLINQWFLIKDRIPERCFQAFLRNNWYGMIMWLGLIVSLPS